MMLSFEMCVWGGGVHQLLGGGVLIICLIGFHWQLWHNTENGPG